MAVYEALLLNTVVPQIQAAQAGDSYVMVVNATTPALRITQTGTGNAISVEDEANPDSSPFVVTAAGDVGIGLSSPTVKLDVVGSAKFAGSYVSFNDNGYIRTDAANILRFQPGSGGYQFRNASNSDNLAVLDASGNLGPGQAPAVRKFEINAISAAVSQLNGIRLQMDGVATSASEFLVGTDSGGVPFSSLRTGNDGNSYMTFFTGSGPTERARITSTGEFQWKPDGTTQAMTLDASGILVLGNTSVTSGMRLDVQGGDFRVGDDANQGFEAGYSAGASQAFIQGYNRGTSAFIDLAVTGSNIKFLSGSSATERARITSGGYFKASNTGTYNGAANAYHENYNSASDEWITWFQSAPATNPKGLRVYYSAAAPNGTANHFLYCDDTGGQRASIRSNGGLANYQSNNVDLSDARTKTDINPLGSYWSKIAGLEIVSYKYKDQTHDDLNIGVIAQQVEAVAPEFVDSDGFGDTPEDGVPLKTIYNKDLTFAAIKALQEAMARIETLEAKIAALEAA